MPTLLLLLLATPIVIALICDVRRLLLSPQERDQAFQDREKRLGGDHG